MRKITRSPSRAASKGRHVASNGLPSIVLPRPKATGERTVEEALRRRRTTREISDKKLSPQLLSNLLWAAFGVNRLKGPFGVEGRTAGSASNSQEIDVYVATKEGVYQFDGRGHALLPVVAGDLRDLARTPGQRNVTMTAPVHLIYVVNIHRLTHTQGFEEPGLHDPEVQKSYYFVDTGLIAGNVYLFAASQGLAAWFHNCDRAALHAKLKLGQEQRVLFAQSVGYPARRNGA
jgi:nitroreductase